MIRYRNMPRFCDSFHKKFPSSKRAGFCVLKDAGILITRLFIRDFYIFLISKTHINENFYDLGGKGDG